MGQQVVITAAHWMYLLGVVVIVITMIFRANVVVPSLLGTLLVGIAFGGSIVSGVTAVFNASFMAAKELFNIFLVIAFMTALLNALKTLGSDVRMVQPFRAVMTNGHIAFVVLALATYLISLFFWPTPAVPLVAAILLPAAIAAGLPPLGAACAIAIAGQGMALSSDYVIGVAPGISAKAAGVATALVAERTLILSLVTGIVALVLAYVGMRRQIQAPSEALLDAWQRRAVVVPESVEESGTMDKGELAAAVDYDSGSVPLGKQGWSRLFAIVTPVVFLLVVLVMVAPRLFPSLPALRGGEAAALVGGAAALLMVAATAVGVPGRDFLNTAADHVTDGFVFAFKAMGSVLPIAGFFFLGAPDQAAGILGVEPGHAPNLLFDLLQAAQGWIPNSHLVVAFGVLIVGVITGIDGSGFSGLPLTGALSGALGATASVDAATLAAVGQMGAIWTGGGTLVAWSSLIAVAGFARVPVLELVRKLFGPVVLGLIVSTVAAVMFMT
ncbi:hypothetical protein [Bordetella bronchiseptica]|uniref:hypothetical protein n=1 Tax=Bordetella bronchiseptica TaxID=518 RepID=UPI00045AE83E|nr:hypothetical protein [Bordetella bronchiseptica]KCV30228.1 putative membrane protein [Bordetella bronchiseptica 00-P-2730]KAK50620.1 putative membrane protein [Bordetella bronchiseptica OSU054]KDB75795.1 putative membrane protein [Bordetella bronchiseptica CA90 BB1334]KDC61577.1 putative membrane protein [Bordetella bronchiseptica MBORD591]KDD46485.1 putative membrane protein [Bordetella bronchiseptica OSU095]